MKNDFKQIEDEMERLVVNMGEITDFNEKINSTFKDKRKELSRLSGINNLLKKVSDFISFFSMPFSIKLWNLSKKSSNSFSICHPNSTSSSLSKRTTQTRSNTIAKPEKRWITTKTCPHFAALKKIATR